MATDIFFKYDLYVLERIYPERKFVEFLNGIDPLNKLIEPFISNVTNLLYDLIHENKNIEITDIVLPNIEEVLAKYLADNTLYISYKSDSDEKLSDFVLNKFLRRIFKRDGSNNETYIIQDYIHAWLEQKLAENIVKDLRFSYLEFLKILLDKTEMLHSFYADLIENIPTEWIFDKKEEWVNINVSPDKLVDAIRTNDKEFITGYIDFISKLEKEDLWEFVQQATHHSDYMRLNHEFSFISSVLIRIDTSLWIEFWDNLKLPIIQDCVFMSSFSFTPNDYLQIISKLTSDNIALKSDLKVLLFILVKNYFETSNRLTERFSLFNEPDRKNERNEDFFEKGLEQRKEWLSANKKNYEIIILSMKKLLSISDVESWIFSYKPRTNARQQRPNDIYNDEIKLLINTYKEKFVENVSFDFNSFNLQKFNFYVEVINKNTNKQNASSLLEAMINYIASDKFFWDRTYAEPYFSALKGLGFIISIQNNPIQIAKEVINKFKTTHQGWNPSKIDFSPLIKESFICSGVVMLFENERAFKDINEKKIFFQELLNHILTQDRFSQIDNSEYYQMPLHLLFLVANQIFPEVKEFYEQELIDNYDNLYSLLSILTNDNTPILDKSKKQLKNRFDSEYFLLKRQFSSRNQKDKAQELDRMINIINFETEGSS